MSTQRLFRRRSAWAGPCRPILERLILGCLEKDPARRPADARTLQHGLRACQDAGAWGEEDARRWLEGHAAALRTRQRRFAPDGAATIAADVAQRSPERVDAADLRD